MGGDPEALVRSPTVLRSPPPCSSEMIVKRIFNPIKVLSYVWLDVSLSIVASVVAALLANYGIYYFSWTFAPLGVLGTALSIFLAFRANTSFARWGEAAAAWAAILAASRTFARLVVTFADSHRKAPQYDAQASAAFKQTVVRRQIAWAHSLRAQLRGQSPGADDGVARMLDPADLAGLKAAPDAPLYLMKRQGESIYDAMASGVLMGFDSFQLEGQLAALGSQQATCERIKGIPVPRQYSYFTRLFVRVFVILVPFFTVKGMTADGVVWLVIPMSAIIAFLFSAIERTGAVNEDPFENRITDVPMTAICRDIERDTMAILGETQLPPKMHPEEGYLF
ncbi:effector locus protein [Hyaloraphidium curvatum]|nr:effector locus protein [Hyaloraphidium curvatum]